MDYVNEERTLPVAFGKAVAASVVYGPFANGLFLAGARALRHGLKVCLTMMGGRANFSRGVLSLPRFVDFIKSHYATQRTDFGY